MLATFDVLVPNSDDKTQFRLQEDVMNYINIAPAKTPERSFLCKDFGKVEREKFCQRQ